LTSPLADIQDTLRKLANPKVATHAQRFFKTGVGEYGEGDCFLGIRTPQLRQVVKAHKHLSVETSLALLKSQFHEERLCAALLFVQLFAGANPEQRASIFHAYLDNTRYLNNWDIVDSSAHQVVGGFLLNQSKKKKLDALKPLALSNILWERRIAIIATYHFIRHNDFSTTLDLAKILLNDKEDLIHKAVGWMLREIGKRERASETDFLDRHYQTMPRTMLRYAIEKFPEKLRKHYLQK
jgi:3-methyladenine DNA glycosylase AlkD